MPYYTDLERWLLRPDAFRAYTICDFFAATNSQGVRATSAPPKHAIVHVDKCMANQRRVWLKNTLRNNLCRSAPVPKANSELFWLRQLLLLPDMYATCDDDIRSIIDSDGHRIVFESFGAAADARGLQKNAKAAEMVLLECVSDTLASPEMCRSCLSILLRNFDCSGHIIRLIRTYWEFLADDSWQETRNLIATCDDQGNAPDHCMNACTGRILRVRFRPFPLQCPCWLLTSTFTDATIFAMLADLPCSNLHFCFIFSTATFHYGCLSDHVGCARALKSTWRPSPRLRP